MVRAGTGAVRQGCEHPTVGGYGAKTQAKRAESPISSIAQGNALGEKVILNIAPCKGNSIEPQKVALTGRNVY